MVQIEFFTPEQQASIPLYKEKWLEIALSTELINQHRAATAIKTAYAAIGKRQPKLEFCSSPQNALSKISSSVEVTEQQSQKFHCVKCHGKNGSCWLQSGHLRQEEYFHAKETNCLTS
ncbi:hypothetical protein QUB80_08180 [Chlorogloeopsis sp. ULAP01]|uniref:hypothetical protein n=1 Tax=Chlorogloeopsis sp. ULAP01 TaxID=3056483 RepID=UPI0025AAE025|nr:hypothetical protein [Chlorogloeopsis sp. ULAP01]MDM9380682.1 hypothetical protein [Chlorogloeopsis sp. ULAP01]